jgi:hypothetical protein
LSQLGQQFKKEALAQFVVLVLCGIMFVPRLMVLARNMPVLIGRQTQQEYIESKYDGWIDQHLQNWYGLK